MSPAVASVPNPSEESKAARRSGAGGAVQSGGMKGDTVRYMRKVFALLLDFATLPEKSRRDFLSRVNEFLIMSPVQKRRAISEWEQAAERRGTDEG